jgi:uroporphyrinogen III methyltransferase/synthase
MTGTVYLVGAGPGDPGLLTLKAARLLGAADVVVYDNLVGDAILDRLPAGVERIAAGKETGVHTMDQAAINALLEERALRGQTVVRLKGGDSFVFGRGGEEAHYLTARGIPIEVVPGVTAAIGVPAYAGIPVTHRGVAASVAIVTGRAGPEGEAAAVEWERVAGADTIVVVMGLANLEPLARTLVAAGRSPDTPVAAIRWGTTASQRVVTGTLATISGRVREAGLRPPATLVVGPVVALRERIQWAERRPLFGRRVLVPADHPDPLTEPLERLGAEVLHVAPVEIGPPVSWEALDGALRQLARFAGVMFADVVGVSAVIQRLAAVDGDVRGLAGRRLVAVPEVVPELARRALRADGLLDAAEPAMPDVRHGQAWLVAGAMDTAAPLAERLRARGVDCVVPPVCAETTPKWRADRLRELLTTRPIDAIAFSNAVQVSRLLDVLDVEDRQGLRRVVLAATASAAGPLRRHGFEPRVTVSDDSAAALAPRLAAALGDERDAMCR